MTSFFLRTSALGILLSVLSVSTMSYCAGCDKQFGNGQIPDEILNSSQPGVTPENQLPVPPTSGSTTRSSSSPSSSSSSNPVTDNHHSDGLPLSDPYFGGSSDAM